eukprot:1293171-Pyramimonas_sp.AAC.1
MLDAEFGKVEFRVVHDISCEVDSAKQHFLREMVGPSHLYGDVKHLLLPHAVNFAASSDGERVSLEPFPHDLGGIICGFPCKDAPASAPPSL